MPGLELDPSAFLLTSNGKVQGDAGMVFYGQPQSNAGAISLDVANKSFSFELGRLPADIDKVAICLTIDKAVEHGQKLSGVSKVFVCVMDGDNSHRFDVETSQMTEAALILLEVYKKNHNWKIRALGQGFNGGLAPLAMHFGVDVSDDGSSGASQEVTPTPASSPKVSLSKITLEKSKPVDLTKPSGKFGKIIVNLNWDAGKRVFFWRWCY